MIRSNKLCKSVQGFDANALYLWAIGQNMLCGEHTNIEPYDGLIDDIIEDRFFGTIECDIDVPEHLTSYFSEMPPIFKNTEVSYNDVSEETKEQLKAAYKSRKLIGSMFARKMLFLSEILKWYLEHGLVISNITAVVQYERAAPFKEFVTGVSNARRKGDISKDYNVLGDSSYGKCINKFLKHESIKIVSKEKYAKSIRHKNYKSHEDLLNGYEF